MLALTFAFTPIHRNHPARHAKHFLHNLNESIENNLDMEPNKLLSAIGVGVRALTVQGHFSFYCCLHYRLLHGRTGQKHWSPHQRAKKKIHQVFTTHLSALSLAWPELLLPLSPLRGWLKFVPIRDKHDIVEAGADKSLTVNLWFNTLFSPLCWTWELHLHQLNYCTFMTCTISAKGGRGKLNRTQTEQREWGEWELCNFEWHACNRNISN